jgi:hypothetical protein
MGYFRFTVALALLQNATRPHSEGKTQGMIREYS